MKKPSLLLIIISAIFLLNSCSFIEKKLTGMDLKPERVHIVDIKGENWLFRGNMPFKGEYKKRSFAYEELMNAFKQRIKYHQYHKDIPKDAYIVDISLLNLFEFEDVAIERNFFIDNYKKGKFINWPVLGVDNLIEGNSKIDMVLTHHDHKIMQKRLSLLTEMLEKKYDKPVIFYVHCNAGCDRTGQFVASYRMTYKASNYFDAMRSNKLECGRKPNKFSVNAIKSYCEYLQERGGKYANICSAI